MSQPHMDNNDLARFLDGGMSKDERGSAVAHLSGSDADAELLADAAYLLRELDPEGGTVLDDEADADPPHADEVDTGTDPKVVPLRPPSTRSGWRRAPARWMVLAAMVAGVLLVPLALSRSGSDGTGDFAVLLKNREAGLPLGWMDDPPWGLRRGGGVATADNPRAAKLGALHTDLALAISARQTEETDPIARQIEHLLADVPAAGMVARYYRDIAARAGGPREALAQTLEDGRNEVAAIVGADHFNLGAWAEAARIAAERRDAAFFRRRASRKMMDRAALLLDGEARATLEAIRTAARPDPPDWPVLETQTRELLRQIAS